MQSHHTLPHYAGTRTAAWLQHALWVVPVALTVLVAAFGPSQRPMNTGALTSSAPTVVDWRGNSGHIPATAVQPAD